MRYSEDDNKPVRFSVAVKRGVKDVEKVIRDYFACREFPVPEIEIEKNAKAGAKCLVFFTPLINATGISIDLERVCDLLAPRKEFLFTNEKGSEINDG